MKRTSKKLDRAYAILRIHSGDYGDKGGFMQKIKQMKPAQVYLYCASYGYYWNVAKQDWQNIKLTLCHVESAYSIAGKADKGAKVADEYLSKLVAGGILRKTKTGYKRTRRVDLAKQYGNFGYGR
jgi:hypothetical protein